MIWKLLLVPEKRRKNNNTFFIQMMNDEWSVAKTSFSEQANKNPKRSEMGAERWDKEAADLKRNADRERKRQRMGEVPFTSQMGRAQSRSREIDEEDEEDLFVCLGNEGDLRACVVSGLRLQITLIFFERERYRSQMFLFLFAKQYAFWIFRFLSFLVDMVNCLPCVCEMPCHFANYISPCNLRLNKYFFFIHLLLY